MPEIEQAHAKEPPSQRRASKAYKIGLAMASIAYPLILAKWGASFPGWLIVIFASVVFGLLLLAGLLHLREIGGQIRLRENFHNHPVRYLLTTALISGLLFGTSVYLAVRPYSGKRLVEHTAAPPSKPLSAPEVAPVQPTKHISKITPSKKSNHQKAPASNKSGAQPSGGPSQQPTVNCNNNDGNCAGINFGQQTVNQYDAPAPVVISNAQATMITDELKIIGGISGEVNIRYEIAAQGSADSAENLARALNGAGITSNASGALIQMNDCNPKTQFPGLYFDCMTEKNMGLANAIALALRDAKVTSRKIQGLWAGYPNATLTILIRKP